MRCVYEVVNSTYVYTLGSDVNREITKTPATMPAESIYVGNVHFLYTPKYLRFLFIFSLAPINIRSHDVPSATCTAIVVTKVWKGILCPLIYFAYNIFAILKYLILISFLNCNDFEENMDTKETLTKFCSCRHTFFFHKSLRTRGRKCIEIRIYR